MKKQAKMLSNLSKVNALGWILAALAFLANIVIIFRGTWAFIHSDGATAILFAREQWAQKSIYPAYWNYGTDIWNFGLNSLLVPLLGICSRWLNARALAVVIQTALAMGVFALFRRAGVLAEKTWFVLLAALLPVSEVVSEHFYFQATYMTMIIYLAAMVLCVFLSVSAGKKSRMAGYVLLAGILVLRIGAGYSMILVFAVPMAASLLLMSIFENHKENTDREKIRRYVRAAAVILVFTAVGVAYNYYLVKYKGLAVSATGDYQFISFDKMGNSAVFLISAFMRLFGAADAETSLLSLGGILKAMAFVYMIFSLFVVPVTLLKRFHKILNDKQKLFFCFSLFSSFFVCYLFVISGMIHSRYLLWIYFYSIINMGIWFERFPAMRWSYFKEIRIGLIAFFFVFMAGTYAFYLTYDYQKNPDRLGVNNSAINNTVDYELLDYLEENHYTRGYALYWQSYANRVASDGKIRLAALTDDWKGPYQWLNSDSWYENEEEPCFVLVTGGQYGAMPETYKKAAYKTEEFKDYKILLFHSAGEVHKLWQKGIKDNG